MFHVNTLGKHSRRVERVLRRPTIMCFSYPESRSKHKVGSVSSRPLHLSSQIENLGVKRILVLVMYKEMKYSYRSPNLHHNVLFYKFKDRVLFTIVERESKVGPTKTIQ